MPVAAAAAAADAATKEPAARQEISGFSEAPSRWWEWRGFKIRYQELGEGNTGPAVVLVHGLFVNADHWRQNMPALAEAGCRVFAIDLLGCGYSDRPPPTSNAARAASGENGRDLTPARADLGTARGGSRDGVDIELRHPVEGSVYNFYTWAEQLADFQQQVVSPAAPPSAARSGSATLVCNSIGTISALQAAVDSPALWDGVFVVNPNFRELHVAENPAPLQPVIALVQRALRAYGQPVFDAAANPATVKQILKEPYADPAAVTDELVDVLLTPLLSPGAADVVFDTLSYSAGPLPEQLLQDPELEAPVWVCYGLEDPWTPAPRVEALARFDSVERVVPLPGVGHCPHDEAPGLVNPLLLEFLARLA